VSPSLLDRLRGAVDRVATPPAPASPGKRQAAVLILVDPEQSHLPVLFVQRADHLRQHAGQIAFPGGATEPDDEDSVATALREAAEEIGVDTANVEVLGLLPPRLTAVSDLWLTPVVGLQRQPFEVRGDGFEVAGWFRVGLADLLTAPHEVRDLEHEGLIRSVHFYDVGGRTIWGVTAAILHDLLARLGRQD
jgi:8-oxo-dGTP pyrophosphatase MutT (NUDIX family)